jgi:hypothetical protein
VKPEKKTLFWWPDERKLGNMQEGGINRPGVSQLHQVQKPFNYISFTAV